MILIMAADSKWAIGYKGDMLTRIAPDLKRFKEITTGGVLVMGRRTYEATGALPNRETVIISRSMKDESMHIVHDLSKLNEYLEENFPNKKVFLIGGASLIDQLIDEVDKAYITFIKKDFEKYDTVMHNLDDDENFVLKEKSEEYEYNGMKYEYRTYLRK